MATERERRNVNINSWIKYNWSAYNEDSITNKWRSKRMQKFERYVEDRILKNDPRKEIQILDVGGVWKYWTSTHFKYLRQSHIVLLNLTEQEIPEQWKERMECIIGDATDMRQYEDGQFDVCFSNSVIEHVGGFKNQKKMASEVVRVGKIGYLQTPNRYFPIEPHFLFPFFQFLPDRIAEFLVMKGKKIKNREKAHSLVKSVRLLNKRELESLFPDARIEKERVFGLTKSYCVFF